MTNQPTKPFHERRRQQFMYEAFYLKNRVKCLNAIQLERDNVTFCRESSDHDLSDIEVFQQYVYHQKFWLWMLYYSGGVDIDKLAPRLGEIVDEFVEWYHCEVERRKERVKLYPEKGIEIEISPVDFDNQIDYQDTLQLISVGLLPRDNRSMFRIIEVMRSNRWRDELFDRLIAGFVDQDDLPKEGLMHEQPYQLLLDCWYEEDPFKQTELVKAYCENWYKYQDGSRWYDGHKHIFEDTGPYYGYWAFEAGGTCYLLDIDDSTIDHMVYPKDVVAYAKKLYAEGRRTSTDEDYRKPPPRLCALHGETVPESGVWFTPALKGEAGRRRFNAGDRLPETAYSDWGEVIWYLEPGEQG
jgi:hypothetical protein